MSEEFDWEIPRSAQPKPEQVSFDLDRALDAMVGLRATIPEDAFTAGVLGPRGRATACSSARAASCSPSAT